MSISNGSRLHDCTKCVSYFSSNREFSCGPCGEEFEGELLSAYCKVGCGHCLRNDNCQRFLSRGGFGDDEICGNFLLDPSLD